ncbi:hypothetical protein N431DRAFT_471433 [Stipitochalara longipes BDJ]|nr:hypothetical protein N431DRAFT_471433 [Stipitochalara longipes BDJ]
MRSGGRSKPPSASVPVSLDSGSRSMPTRSSVPFSLDDMTLLDIDLDPDVLLTLAQDVDDFAEQGRQIKQANKARNREQEKARNSLDELPVPSQSVDTIEEEFSGGGALIPDDFRATITTQYDLDLPISTSTESADPFGEASMDNIATLEDPDNKDLWEGSDTASVDWGREWDRFASEFDDLSFPPIPTQQDTEFPESMLSTEEYDINYQARFDLPSELQYTLSSASPDSYPIAPSFQSSPDFSFDPMDQTDNNVTSWGENLVYHSAQTALDNDEGELPTAPHAQPTSITLAEISSEDSSMDFDEGAGVSSAFESKKVEDLSMPAPNMQPPSIECPQVVQDTFFMNLDANMDTDSANIESDEMEDLLPAVSAIIPAAVLQVHTNIELDLLPNQDDPTTPISEKQQSFILELEQPLNVAEVLISSNEKAQQIEHIEIDEPEQHAEDTTIPEDIPIRELETPASKDIDQQASYDSPISTPSTEKRENIEFVLPVRVTEAKSIFECPASIPSIEKAEQPECKELGLVIYTEDESEFFSHVQDTPASQISTLVESNKKNGTPERSSLGQDNKDIEYPSSYDAAKDIEIITAIENLSLGQNNENSEVLEPHRLVKDKTDREIRQSFVPHQLGIEKKPRPQMVRRHEAALNESYHLNEILLKENAQLIRQFRAGNKGLKADATAIELLRDYGTDPAKAVVALYERLNLSKLNEFEMNGENYSLRERLRNQEERINQLVEEQVEKLTAKRLSEIADKEQSLDRDREEFEAHKQAEQAAAASRDQDLASREQELDVKQAEYESKLYAIEDREAKLEYDSKKVEILFRQKEASENDLSSTMKVKEAEEKLKRIREKHLEDHQEAGRRIASKNREIEQLKQKAEDDQTTAILQLSGVQNQLQSVQNELQSVTRQLEQAEGQLSLSPDLRHQLLNKRSDNLKEAERRHAFSLKSHANNVGLLNKRQLALNEKEADVTSHLGHYATLKKMEKIYHNHESLLLENDIEISILETNLRNLSAPVVQPPPTAAPPPTTNQQPFTLASQVATPSIQRSLSSSNSQHFLNFSFQYLPRFFSRSRRPKNIDQFPHVDISPSIKIRRHPKVPSWFWFLLFLLAYLILRIALLGSSPPRISPLSKPGYQSSSVLDTCHMSQKPVVILQPTPALDLLCLSDYSNNSTIPSTLPTSVFLVLDIDLLLDNSDHSSIAPPSTWSRCKTLVWDLVTGAADEDLGVGVRRLNLYL